MAQSFDGAAANALVNPFENPFEQARSGSPDPWASWDHQQVTGIAPPERELEHQEEHAAAPANDGPLSPISDSHPAAEVALPAAETFVSPLPLPLSTTPSQSPSPKPLERVTTPLSPLPVVPDPPVTHHPSSEIPVQPPTHISSPLDARPVLVPHSQVSSFASLALGGETPGWTGSQSLFINDTSNDLPPGAMSASDARNNDSDDNQPLSVSLLWEGILPHSHGLSSTLPLFHGLWMRGLSSLLYWSPLGTLRRLAIPSMPILFIQCTRRSVFPSSLLPYIFQDSLADNISPISKISNFGPSPVL